MRPPETGGLIRVGASTYILVIYLVMVMSCSK